jgi:hypothetical protein
MGTNGLVGVRFNDEFHLIYQFHDSYPESLGEEVVNFVQTLQNNPIRMLLFTENIAKVEWVDKSANPISEQVEKLLDYPEILIHLEYNCDWYTSFIFDPLECLEYVILYELSIIPDHKRNSFEVDFTYIIDLNRGVLELYRQGVKMGEFSFEELVGANQNTWSNVLLAGEDY